MTTMLESIEKALEGINAHGVRYGLTPNLLQAKVSLEAAADKIRHQEALCDE